MGGRKANLLGEKFNRLLVIEEAPSKGSKTRWKCLCDCGKETVVNSGCLISGNTKSCGCLNLENTIQKGHARKINLLGKRFGRLVVIREAPNKGIGAKSVSTWTCLCDCGKEKIVPYANLVKGNTRSCGCLAIEIFLAHNNGYDEHGNPKVLDLVGEVYGYLRVLEKAENNKRTNKSQWLCLCTLCGTQKIVATHELRQGGTKSCGCLIHRPYEDLTGRKFGRLLVLGYVFSKKDKGFMWECRCDCGSIKIVAKKWLLNGKYISCGCLIKEVRKSKTGNKNPRYNPNATAEHRASWRQSTEYWEWITRMNERDSKVCAICGVKTGRICHHHIFNYRDYPNLRYELSNGVSICKEHHKLFHSIFGIKHNTEEEFDMYKSLVCDLNPITNYIEQICGVN